MMKSKKISKELILNTAIGIADKKGLKNLTLKDIANELGIKTPSLYNHVKGLDDVYNLLANLGLNMLKKEITNATIAISGKDTLYSIARAYRNFALHHPSLYESTQWVSIWSDSESKRIADDIIDVLFKVLAPYKFSHDKNVSVIRMVRSYLHGFSTLEINQSFGLEVDVNSSFEMGLKIIIESVIAEA